MDIGDKTDGLGNDLFSGFFWTKHKNRKNNQFVQSNSLVKYAILEQATLWGEELATLRIP